MQRHAADRACVYCPAGDIKFVVSCNDKTIEDNASAFGGFFYTTDETAWVGICSDYWGQVYDERLDGFPTNNGGKYTLESNWGADNNQDGDICSIQPFFGEVTPQRPGDPISLTNSQDSIPGSTGMSIYSDDGRTIMVPGGNVWHEPNALWHWNPDNYPGKCVLAMPVSTPCMNTLTVATTP